MSQGERRKYTMEQTGGLHSCTLHLLHEYQKKNLSFVGRNEALGMDGKCLGSCWDAVFLLAFLCNKSVWQTIPYRTRTNHRSGYPTSFDRSLIDNLLENTILYVCCLYVDGGRTQLSSEKLDFTLLQPSPTLMSQTCWCDSRKRYF